MNNKSTDYHENNDVIDVINAIATVTVSVRVRFIDFTRTVVFL